MPDTEQEYKKQIVFYQFLPLAGIFPFSQMLFDLHQIRLMGIRNTLYGEIPGAASPGHALPCVCFHDFVAHPSEV